MTHTIKTAAELRVGDKWLNMMCTDIDGGMVVFSGEDWLSPPTVQVLIDAGNNTVERAESMVQFESTVVEDNGHDVSGEISHMRLAPFIGKKPYFTVSQGKHLAIEGGEILSQLGNDPEISGWSRILKVGVKK